MANSDSGIKGGLVFPSIVVLLTPALTALGSWALSGSWSTWFLAISIWAWITLPALLILWVIAIYIRLRIKAMERRFPSVDVVHADDWRDLASMTHAGVLWRVREPYGLPDRLAAHLRRPIEDIDVDSPPRCPECQTVLEEKPRFFGGYLWSCVNCKFRIKNKDGFSVEADRAQRLAQRREEEKEERRERGPFG